MQRKNHVRSTLECGGSTLPWSPFSALCQGGVEPPHSKVLRTAIFMKAVNDHKLDNVARAEEPRGVK